MTMARDTSWSGSTPIEGTRVVTADGNVLGTVKEVSGTCFKVDARMQPDYWLASDCIATRTGDDLRLGITKAQLSDVKLDGPDHTGVHRHTGGQTLLQAASPSHNPGSVAAQSGEHAMTMTHNGPQGQTQTTTQGVGSPISNEAYNVIAALHSKLEGLEAYRKYQHDGGGQVWQQLTQHDIQGVELLIQQLEQMIKEGKFRMKQPGKAG